MSDVSVESYALKRSVAPRKDYRRPAALAFLLGVLALGWLVAWVPGRSVDVERLDSRVRKESGFSMLQTSPADASSTIDELVVMEPKVNPQNADELAARDSLKAIARMINSKRYTEALIALDKARPQLQQHAESYLLLGRALEGKKDHVAARDFYNAALDRDPTLAEAYWGMATSSEALGDLETALGGMRSFLHTVSDPDPYRLRVAQARSAIWEWEAKLGRGPWGPTKGIIPGLTPEQAAKNDRGVGIMMPIPGTEQPDGSQKFEVKNQDRFEIFKKK